MSQTFAHGYALIIGVSDNAVARWALPGVSKDVVALVEVLGHPERCGYPPDHVRVMDGAESTRQGILDGLDWLHGRVKEDESQNATVVVFYSGHGFRDTGQNPPDYYLVPYDAKESAQGGPLASSLLRATDLADTLAALLPRRLLVILDCCHAAGMDFKGMSGRSGRYEPTGAPIGVFMSGEKAIAGSGGTVPLDALTEGHGRAVLSSSQAHQSSYVRRDGSMSVFTYHLIEALTGHAQPRDGATEVLVSDVVGHVTRRVKASSLQEGRAVPQEPDFALSGNFPVALLLGGKGLAKGEAAPDPLVAPAPVGQGPAPGGSRSVAARDITGAAVVAGDGNVISFGTPPISKPK